MTHDRRVAVEALHEAGHSDQDIAERMHIDERTVQHWHVQFALTGCFEDAARSGRPSKLNADQRSAIVAYSQRLDANGKKVGITPAVILNHIPLPVSKRTVRRALDDVGLHARVARKSIPLSEANKRERVAFAKAHRHWTAADWSLVIFADETIFPQKYTGRQWVQRRENEEYLPENVADKVAHPPQINAWGCFSAAGMGTLYTFTETLDGQYMKSILDSCLLESRHKLIPGREWYFMHDNAPTHTDQQVEKWIFRKNIPIIVMPPYSPDLNPAENLWAMLKRDVRQRAPTDVDALHAATHAAWQAVNPQYLLRLVESMPVRCAKIIANNGNRIHY